MKGVAVFARGTFVHVPVGCSSMQLWMPLRADGSEKTIWMSLMGRIPFYQMDVVHAWALM